MFRKISHLTSLRDKVKQDGIHETGSSLYEEGIEPLASSNAISSPELVELQDLSEKWRNRCKTPELSFDGVDDFNASSGVLSFC